MPPKRKLRRDDSESSEDQTSSKKVKQVEILNEDDEGQDLNTQAVYKEVLDHIYKQRDHDENRPLWKMFDVLPSKEEFPVYYDYIENPIDLKTIKKRIQTQYYSAIDELESDILLLISNAHAFNEPRSQISKDATCLKRAYYAKRSELNKSTSGSKVNRRGKSRKASRTTSVDSEISEVSEFTEDDKEESEDTTPVPVKTKRRHQIAACDLSSFAATSPSQAVSPSESKDDGLIGQSIESNPFAFLYDMLAAFVDPATGRKLSTSFLRLPLRKSYPDYYEVIKRPLSLGKIKTKIKASYYSDLNILEKDLNCVFDNAQQYNQPGSSLHSDAVQLQNFMREKKHEIEITQEYIDMRELLPKRGRPRLVKTESGEELQSPVTVKKHSQQSTPDNNDPKSLSKRLLLMYNCILDYKDSEGRMLSEMFLELPDKKEYPDYYKVILNPIDMEMICERIERNHYMTEMDFIHDFEILFQNARHFNEEDSEVYEDSIILEKALKKKRRWLSHVTDGKNASPMKPPRSSNSPALFKKLQSGQCLNINQELLQYIRNYVDDTGRCLASIFERLPTRSEYPDYYQLIKRPIDLVYISSRVNKYATLVDLEQDLLLLFDNACHFNEPDSQIYKDALTLLRAMIAKKAELQPDMESHMPDVQALVKNLLHRLYTNVMNHTDEEGRNYSDSLLELMYEPDEISDEAKKRKAISLPIIGQLLKLGFYERLDQLQEDIFSILKKAREDGRTDSEMYEDACELQAYFTLERDRLTKDGLRLMSPALNFTVKSIQHEIDDERKEKLRSESKVEDNDEDDDDRRRSKLRSRSIMTVEVQPDEDGLSYLQSLCVEGLTYRIGDFVYVKPEELNRPPHIVSIEKIWAQKNGAHGIYGCWYFRPEATFHLASRKFMEREVFRSQHYSYILFTGVISRCYVMNVKEYAKMKPQGFLEDDIYVCESRYNGKTKLFKKFKTSQATPSHIILDNRSQPLEIKRVSSVFLGNADKKREGESMEKEQIVLTSTEGYEIPLEKHLETEVSNSEEGFVYFEKYVTNNSDVKIGDGVYIKSDEGYLLIIKVDRIWKNASDTVYVQGNLYVTPEDTKHYPTRFFYKQECFESNVEEVSSMSNVVGKCAILNLRDYQYSRPTEILEKDVYLCSAHYNEDELKFRRNVKGFKRQTLPSHIRDDEYWYFDQPVNPKRRPSLWLTSGHEQNESDTPVQKEPEVSEDVGYALMKKEYAAQLMKESPELSVDEIQSKTNERWEGLIMEEKEVYKNRAKAQGLVESLYVFECQWSHCEYQFEDMQDLIIHVIEGPHIFKSASTGMYKCEWRSCDRKKHEKQPFGNHSRLVRHIREIHFKCKQTKILTSEKTKFYFPRHQSRDDGFKNGSEGSERPSSRGSSTVSSLSPSNPIKNQQHQAMLQQKAISMLQNTPTLAAPNIPNGGPMQMHAGMFPPFRMNGQQLPQHVLQQQMYQQQMMLQARGQMLAASSPVRTPGMTPPIQQPPQPPVPQPGTPQSLSVEQQQMLLTQVQRQQQQIQSLQQQVQQLVQQQQEKQQEEEEPVFVAPPPCTMKLRHSEAYLRYIEGLRDNKSALSHWSEQSSTPHPKSNNPLPTHWLNKDHGYDSAVDALWALRDHMLRDAVTLTKYV